MKKWLIAFAALVIAGFFIRYLVVYKDVYVDLRPDAPVQVAEASAGKGRL